MDIKTAQSVLIQIARAHQATGKLSLEDANAVLVAINTLTPKEDVSDNKELKANKK